MLEPHGADNLFPADLPEPGVWEQRYPPRELPEGAEVTRLAPSPTGFIHLGGIYAAMIDRAVAHQTGGRYFVRIEDTDQSREVAGGGGEVGPGAPPLLGPFFPRGGGGG